jgi:hypothetical protein
MAEFLFAYHVPTHYTPGGPDTMAVWRAWFDSMGPDLVDLGKPVAETSTLGAHGPETRLGGYSVVHADDLEAAVAIAKGCPALQLGGGVEVGALVPVPS